MPWQAKQQERMGKAAVRKFWDERYSGVQFAYGVEPNDFLAAAARHLLPSSKVLSIGEGEGRNATFLAKQSHRVCAVDQSEIGLQKATKLALSHECSIETAVADLEDYQFGELQWDAVVSIFCHTPKALRMGLYLRIKAGLKVGGIFIVEAYAPEQLARDTGGPKEIDNLVPLEELLTEFLDFEVIHAQATTRLIQEGQFHQGLSDVTQFIGRKK